MLPASQLNNADLKVLKITNKLCKLHYYILRLSDILRNF